MKKIALLCLLIAMLTQSATAQNIVAGEYFFDTDPGLGNGTALPTFAPSDTVVQSFTVNISTLSIGFHRIYIRYKDVNNKWGSYQGHQFYILPAAPAFPVMGALVVGEYFFDTDPGLGNGTALPSFSPTDTIVQSFSINVNTLSAGFHRIYLRYKDANNKWGLYQGYQFYVLPTAPALPVAGNIVSGEYFFDTDPGVGNGTALPAFTPGDTVLLNTSIAMNGLTVGSHHLYVRYKDSNNKWGAYQTDTFSVLSCAQAFPAFSVNNNALCLGDTLFISDNSTGTTTGSVYSWDIDNNGVVDYTTAGNVAHLYAMGGTYNVKLSIANGPCQDSSEQTIVVNSIDTSVTLAGMVLTSNQSNATYQWINCSNNAPIAGQIGASFTPTANGSYAVVISDNGCMDTSKCYQITVVGTQFPILSFDAQVYPNPFSDNLRVDIKGDKDVFAKVYTVSGVLVYEKQLFAQSENEVEINQAAGLYLLELTTAEGRRTVVKIVKR